MKCLNLFVCLALIVTSSYCNWVNGRSSTGVGHSVAGPNHHTNSHPHHTPTPHHHIPVYHKPTTPIHKPSTPVHHNPTPIHRQNTPIHHNPTPHHQTPVYHKPATPIHRPNTPVHHNPTPIHHRPNTPVHHNPTPVHHSWISEDKTHHKPTHHSWISEDKTHHKPTHHSWISEDKTHHKPTPTHQTPTTHTPPKPTTQTPTTHTPPKPTTQTPPTHTPPKPTTQTPPKPVTNPVQNNPKPVQPPTQAGGLTPDQLKKIMPGAQADKVAEYTPYLNQAMKDAGINTPARQNAFLAQLALESGQFHYMEEIASGKAYEGRRDLGNTQPGDGERYKGRGPIQITGRSNYAQAGKDLGLDLVNHPELAAKPEVGFKIAAWYWNTRHLNDLADKNTPASFSEITRRVNGCADCPSTHAPERNAYWNRANEVNN